MRLFSVMLLTLSLGLSSAAQADMKWFESMRGFCPNVCQKNADYKFAVPGGINPKATEVRGSESVYYVCATSFSGWRIGFNIDYQQDRCYAEWHRLGGGNSFGEHYFCLCTDKEMPLITDDMVRR